MASNSNRPINNTYLFLLFIYSYIGILVSRTNNPLSAFILDIKAQDQTKGKVCTISFNDSAYPGYL